MPNRPVHLPFETESAAPAAALAHLEQRHVPVLGVRGLHDGDRLERVHVAQPPLGHDRRQTRRRRDLGDGAILRVGDGIAGGHVDTFDGRRLRQKRLAIGGRAIGVDQLAHQLLALAHGDQVHERRDGLGVGERAHTAHEDDRIVRATFGRAIRDTRLAQQAQHIDVVALIGDGEPDDVEVGERSPRLERRGDRFGASALRLVCVVGKEDALADDVGALVEVPVDRLEPEVGHSDGVGVRIDEGYGDLAAPVLADRALFVGEQRVCFVSE